MSDDIISEYIRRKQSQLLVFNKKIGFTYLGRDVYLVTKTKCGRCGGTETIPSQSTAIKCPECRGTGLAAVEWTEADEVGAVTAHETKR